MAPGFPRQVRNEEGMSAKPKSGQWVDRRVEEEWVAELCSVAGFFARDGLETGRERLVPLDRE